MQPRHLTRASLSKPCRGDPELPATRISKAVLVLVVPHDALCGAVLDAHTGAIHAAPECTRCDHSGIRPRHAFKVSRFTPMRGAVSPNCGTETDKSAQSSPLGVRRALGGGGVVEPLLDPWLSHPLTALPVRAVE